MRSRKQIPGQLYTFVSKKLGLEDTGTLPKRPGDSNSFAYYNGGDRPSWASVRFNRINHANRRRAQGFRVCGKQESGKTWEFIDKKSGVKDVVVLPELGESNDQVYWHTNPSSKNGGTWSSRKLRRLRSQGNGGDGLIERMRMLVRAGCRTKGYIPIKNTPEEMLDQWKKQNGKCAACGGFLDLLKASYDHDHDTGEGRGFVHRWCNHAEGFVRQMSNDEFDSFVLWEKHKRGIL